MGVMKRSLLITCLLILTQASAAQSNIVFVDSKAKHFKVSAQPQKQEVIPVNQFHRWVIKLNDPTGQAVYPAKFSIGGGMPAHGHGLPTQPMVTEYLGDGQYLIEGVKFNMDGQWLLKFQIVTPTQQDMVEFNVDVQY